MSKTFVFAGILSAFVSLSAYSRNPEGEFAKYKLDRNQSRTSSLIKKGTLVFSVGPFKPDSGSSPGSYPSKLTYDIRAAIAGHLHGEKVLDIPAEFFTPEFVIRLRKEGTIDEGIFKLKHMGFEDVQTIFGMKYPQCDKILAYDVKLSSAKDFASLLMETMGQAYYEEIQEDFDHDLASVKNAKVLFYLSPGIPVIGAVKLDASAKISGFAIKAGFDYLPKGSPDTDHPAQDILK